MDITQQGEGRLWLTRPPPRIDRVASGWLITRFIDLKVVFIFDSDADPHPDSVPFDMYQSDLRLCVVDSAFAIKKSV